MDERIRAIIPPGLMEGLAAWNAAGRVGPIQMPSMTGSNSRCNDVSPDVVTQPAANTAVLHNAPEREIDMPAAGTGRVSTLAELNAVTKVTN